MRDRGPPNPLSPHPGPGGVRRLVFLGPPGAGKGTQAVLLAREQKLAHLSTGDMLRAAVAAQTPLGQEADGYIRAGRLVPDELVLRILKDRLRQPDAASGFVLDGFPRNRSQAEALERISSVDAVVSFEIPNEILVQRLSARRICPKCQSVYNVESRPPRIPGRCDLDGSELVQRPDDLPEAVATRLDVYAKATAPLLDYYRERSLLRPVNARGTPEEVALQIRALVHGTP